MSEIENYRTINETEFRIAKRYFLKRNVSFEVTAKALDKGRLHIAVEGYLKFWKLGDFIRKLGILDQNCITLYGGYEGKLIISIDKNRSMRETLEG